MGMKAKKTSEFPHSTTAKVANLVPYVSNARTHSDAQIAQIAASISEFGFTSPILTDGDNGIIAGHGRLLAARKLGMETVPVIELAHLTATQRKAYILADNRIALSGGWDDSLLALEFAELGEAGFDLDLTGFNADEIGSIMRGSDFDPGTEDDQGTLDELSPKIATCPSCGYSWDSRES